MLNIKITNYIILLIIIMINNSCFNNNNKEIDLKKRNIEFVGSNEYYKIYNSINDSVKLWSINQISNFKYHPNSKFFFADSILCFNSQKNKFISALLNFNMDNENSDGIDFLYGFKSNENWYFLRGAYVVIPRDMLKNHPLHQPLSYQQLHEMALKNVYKGYLNPDGTINDLMFEHYFPKKESEFKTHKEYERYYLALAKNVWLERYQPYSERDFQIRYLKDKKELHVSFPLKTYDSINCPPIKYKLLYEYDGLGYIGNIFINDFSPEINWYKTPVINATIPNIPPDKPIKLYLEVLHYPNGMSPRYGPFVYETTPMNAPQINS